MWADLAIECAPNVALPTMEAIMAEIGVDQGSRAAGASEDSCVRAGGAPAARRGSQVRVGRSEGVELAFDLASGAQA